MDNAIFLVNDEPYCIWEHDLKQRNLKFLNGIDVGYFDYMLDTLLSSEDEKRASVALRITYYHALETLFSLIGAMLQAPNCAYAWVAKCSNAELRKVIEKIDISDIEIQRKALSHKLKVDHVSWKVISALVFIHYLPGTERNKTTSKLFATLWQRLASRFLDAAYIEEYNSLKHGFRIRSGGFAIATGIQHEPGVPAPEEEMRMLGSSEFGASHIKIETIGSKKGNRCLKSKDVSSNWAIEEVALLLQLTSMSIKNVVSILKILNGEKASDLEFIRPDEDSDFERAWSYSPGVLKAGLRIVLNESIIPFQSKKDLLNKLQEARNSNAAPNTND